MISIKVINKNTLLLWIKEEVNKYCNSFNIPYLTIRYGIIPNKSKAVFRISPPEIVIWENCADWLSTFDHTTRVWVAYRIILHELEHYKQCIFAKRQNKILDTGIFNEDDAYNSGDINADIILKKLSKEEINPMKINKKEFSTLEKVEIDAHKHGDHIRKKDMDCPLCRAGKRNLVSNPTSSASGLYEAFHGTNPKTKTPIHFVEPKGELVKIGDVSRIDYVPGENSKHRNINFFHSAGDKGEGQKLKTNWVLAVDASGKNFYLIKKNQNSEFPKFTERGIIG